MCGIAGKIRFGEENNKDSEEVQELLIVTKHRGPDASNVKKLSEKVFFGNNRLRITDAKNKKTDMPFASKDGNLCITYNGEVYNHQEIRREILRKNPEYKFRTNCDTETVLAAYEIWGGSCVEKFDGMFALAIFNKKTHETFLGVDPTGQKTIYYHFCDDGITFASEIDALIQDNKIKKSFNIRGIKEFISQRFIIGSETHISEIHKLEPGTTLKIDLYNHISKNRYYSVPIGNQEDKHIPNIANRILAVAEKGIRKVVSKPEVPCGMLLSGGIDSSAVYMKCKSWIKNTFSTGFKLSKEQLEKQDHQYAEELSKANTHSNFLMSESDYLDYLDQWIECCGEPLGSQEAACLVKLFETAKKENPNIKVLFTGSGPDELFDGYGYGKKLENLLSANKETSDYELAKCYVDSFHWCGEVDLDRLMSEGDWYDSLVAKYEGILQLYEEHELAILQKVQLMHFHGRLPVYECRQMDVVSSRFSTEARAPFLSNHMIKEAFNFDPELKNNENEETTPEKYIFKKALKSIVPQNIFERKKGGYPIPSEIWFSKEFEERVEKSIFSEDSCLAEFGIVDQQYLREIWEKKTPETRNIFSRLYTLEGILKRQVIHMSLESRIGQNKSDKPLSPPFKRQYPLKCVSRI